MIFANSFNRYFAGLCITGLVMAGTMTLALYAPPAEAQSAPMTSSAGKKLSHSGIGKSSLDEGPTVGEPSAVAGIGTYDDRSTRIQYDGAWRTMTSRSDMGGASTYLNSAGSAEFTFTGDAIQWFSRLSPSSGINNVYIDGSKVASVDRYSASNSFSTKVFERRDLGNRSHTITVTWTGARNAASSGGNLLVDAFVVVDTASSPAPSGVTGAPFSSGVKLNWAAPGSGDIANYRIYRAPDKSSSFSLIGTTDGGTTTFHDVGLGESVSWVYQVSAINVAGNESARSSMSTVTSGTDDIDSTFRMENCPESTVVVSTAVELRNALAAARPGAVIKLQSGTYSGQFKLTASGTPSAPIWVCGPRSAVIDGGQISDLHGLFIDSVNDVVVTGITIQNALKGVTVKSSTRVTLSDLLVQDIGYEGIHFKQFTKDSDVIASTVTRTGRLEKKYGEGIYIGSSEPNWCTMTACQPDRVDGSRLIRNTISDTGAQSIEVKEGTSDGIIHGNHVDDSNAVSGDSSWILVKGNGWLISNNVGSNSRTDGFSTNASVAGWGMNNVFVRNSAAVNAAGFGIWIHEPVGRGPVGNIVGCENQSTGAGAGMTNVACQP